MSKSIFITGSSSGIGKAAAIYFAEKGWRVVATMRKLENEYDLRNRNNIHLIPLDVTDLKSIETAIKSSIEILEQIDVVVNNAGYGTAGPFEAATQEQIKRQFDTNLFGMMDVTRGFIPHFRSHGSGRFINISSIGGLVTFPLYSLYHATKWAMEGFTESLAYELAPFGIRMKLVEPGGVVTDFATRSLDVLFDADLQIHYAETVEKVTQAFRDPERRKNYSPPELMAEIIYEAACDDSDRLRYVAGADAVSTWELRKEIGDDAFRKIIRERMMS